jgi:hypothetical protein
MGRFEWTQLGSERATLARRSPVPDVDGAGVRRPVAIPHTDRADDGDAGTYER